jgi:hypothetical protein
MTDNPLVWFWTAMVFASIAWYSYLLFHIGIKGGWEIFRMTRVLSGRPDAKRTGPEEP